MDASIPDLFDMLISGSKKPLFLSDEAGNEPFGHAPIVLP